MIKINYMSTLFVGIDVSSKSNVVFAMDFDENKFLSSSFSNNQPGADELAGMIHDCMVQHPNLNTIVVAMESTSVYSIHMPITFLPVRHLCLISLMFIVLTLKLRLIIVSLTWQWIKPILLTHT